MLHHSNAPFQNIRNCTTFNLNSMVQVTERYSQKYRSCLASLAINRNLPTHKHSQQPPIQSSLEVVTRKIDSKLKSKFSSESKTKEAGFRKKIVATVSAENRFRPIRPKKPGPEKKSNFLRIKFFCSSAELIFFSSAGRE